MHVVAHGDDDATLVVADGSPSRHVAVLFIGPACSYILLTGHLEAVVEVVQHVKDLIAVLQVLDRAIREDLAHSVHEAQSAVPGKSSTIRYPPLSSIGDGTRKTRLCRFFEPSKGLDLRRQAIGRDPAEGLSGHCLALAGQALPQFLAGASRFASIHLRDYK